MLIANTYTNRDQAASANRAASHQHAASDCDERAQADKYRRTNDGPYHRANRNDRADFG
jgi:hypothetical protein